METQCSQCHFPLGCGQTTPGDSRSADLLDSSIGKAGRRYQSIRPPWILSRSISLFVTQDESSWALWRPRAAKTPRSRRTP